MHQLIIIFTILGTLLVINTLISKDKKETPDKESGQYRLRPALLTATEQSFLTTLEEAVGGEYKVYAQVRLADIADVKPTANRSAYYRALNQVTSKHVDFVLCRPDNLGIKCGIELNDSTHNRPDRRQRDTFVRSVFKEIGLPLIEIRARRNYDVEALKQQIHKHTQEVTQDERKTERERTMDSGHPTERPERKTLSQDVQDKSGGGEVVRMAAHKKDKKA